MITLDSPTRQLPVWRDNPGRPRRPSCPHCLDSRAALTSAEAHLVLELSGGRKGAWLATGCTLGNGWHMVKRTHHERCGALDRLVRAVAALVTVAAAALSRSKGPYDKRPARDNPGEPLD